jgi:hypothetical protein
MNLLLREAKTWGAPVLTMPDACDYPRLRLPIRLRRAVEQIEDLAGWPEEVTAYIIGMIMQGQAARLRTWRRRALEKIGGADYASSVIGAVQGLVAMMAEGNVEEEDREGSKEGKGNAPA